VAGSLLRLSAQKNDCTAQAEWLRRHLKPRLSAQDKTGGRSGKDGANGGT